MYWHVGTFSPSRTDELHVVRARNRGLRNLLIKCSYTRPNTTERQRQVKRKAAWNIFQGQIKKHKVRVAIEEMQPHWGAAPPSGAAQQVPQGAEDQDSENTDGRSEGDQYDDQG